MGSYTYIELTLRAALHAARNDDLNEVVWAIDNALDLLHTIKPKNMEVETNG